MQSKLFNFYCSVSFCSIDMEPNIHMSEIQMDSKPLLRSPPNEQCSGRPLHSQESRKEEICRAGAPPAPSAAAAAAASQLTVESLARRRRRRRSNLPFAFVITQIDGRNSSIRAFQVGIEILHA